MYSIFLTVSLPEEPITEKQFNRKRKKWSFNLNNKSIPAFVSADLQKSAF